MDSFLEEPRATPKPTPVIQTIETPTVPEVSLMFQNSRKDKCSPINFGKNMQSYNAWKLRSNSNNNEFDSFLLASGNKENTQQNNIPEKSFLSKKQVRFQSPIHKSASAPNFSVNKNIEHLLPPANFQRTSDNTTKIHDNSLKHVETQSTTTNCSPIRLDSNTLFPSTSTDTLKRLETLGNSNEFRCMTPKSPLPFMKPPKSNNTPSNAFEKIYCSGIPTPNKELDLSFLEPQKNPCPRQEYFQRPISDSPSKRNSNYTDHYNICTTQFDKPFVIPTQKKNETIPLQNDSNYKSHDDTENISNINLDTKTNENKSKENEIQSENLPQNSVKDTDNSKTSTNEGPSVNDLLQIIKLQNEQLQRLQSQVEMLVKLSDISQKEKNQSKTENVHKNLITHKDQQVGVSSSDEIIEQHKETNVGNIENNGKKISVGMMTSFEVSFKPPPTKKKNKTKLRNLTPVSDFSNNEYSSSTTAAAAVEYPIKQQRTRDEYRNDECLKRNRIDNQRDERHPPNTWHNNNNNNRRTNETEYSLGCDRSLEVQEAPESPENSIHIDMQDYDTESEDSDDECSTDTGWTFYNDILGQVNNLLENSNRPTYRPNKLPNKRHAAISTETETTLEQIQQNALKRLQNDGFLQPSDQCAIRPNEISFAVKQILMKYLPDDGLADVITKNKHEERYNTDKRKPTDISVTAVKYMQQCNVITNAPQYYGRKQKINKNPLHTKNKMIPSSGDPKILDITTLKQQPKLL